MDTNRDGQITKEEFTAVPHPGATTERIFADRDQNSDGVLTMDEFCAPARIRTPCG